MPSGRVHLDNNRFAKFTSDWIIFNVPNQHALPRVYSGAPGAAQAATRIGRGETTPRHVLLYDACRLELRDPVINLSSLLARMDRRASHVSQDAPR
jgi:hypothetical protein